MTDRDRLIEIIGDKPFSSEYENYNSWEWAEHFADYLLSNGVIVLPIKVGTKVYVITSQTSNGKNLYIFEDIITHYLFDEQGGVMCFENHMGVANWNWDKVFLTKEEAEKALEERTGENE